MKKLDSKNLFAIFVIGDEELTKQFGIDHLSTNAFLLLGMTIKGVENFYIIEQIYTNRFPEEYDSVKDSIKLKYFITLVGYLERVKEISSEILFDIVDEFGECAIDYALSEMLEFFEEVEYYEKCVVVKKYIDIFSNKSC